DEPRAGLRLHGGDAAGAGAGDAVGVLGADGGVGGGGAGGARAMGAGVDGLSPLPAQIGTLATRPESQGQLPSNGLGIALERREPDAPRSVFDSADRRFLRLQPLGDLLLRQAGLFSGPPTQDTDLEILIA